MKKPKFTVNLSLDEMEILAIALLQYAQEPIDDASACAAETLIDKLIHISEMELLKPINWVLR